MASNESVEECDNFALYNDSELRQLCTRVGLAVSPTMTKEELAGVLSGAIESAAHNPIDNIRYGIMAFLLDHWKRASSQLFCPAKSGDPKACHQCVDAQVVYCLVTNPSIEPGVLAHIRKKEETDGR